MVFNGRQWDGTKFFTRMLMFLRIFFFFFLKNRFANNNSLSYN